MSYSGGRYNSTIRDIFLKLNSRVRYIFLKLNNRVHDIFSKLNDRVLLVNIAEKDV